MLSESDVTPEKSPLDAMPEEGAGLNYEKSEIEKIVADKTTFEEKIHAAICEMRKCVSRENEPDFQGFWEAKKLALLYFKEHLNPMARSQLWSEYLELVDEAKNLKDILEEQVSFAMEQIELAITGVEEELKNYQMLLERVPLIDFPEKCRAISGQKEFYLATQRELTLLNGFATRVNSLRKEIINLDMRLRFKNKFFRRLSVLGDNIFPKRKELIKKISSQFISDISNFASEVVDKPFRRIPFYIIKQDIKDLQNLAKNLSLNTKAFTECRLLLSKCWDKIKLEEKERKQEFAQKQDAMEEVGLALKKELDELFEKGLEPDLKTSLEKFSTKISKSELRQEDIRDLKEKVNSGLDQIRQHNLQIEMEKKKDFQKLKDDISLLENDAAIDKSVIVDLESRVNHYFGEEREILFSALNSVKSKITEREEENTLETAIQDGNVELLNEILEKKYARRETMKEELEKCRKEVHKSGFDFEKAMVYGEAVEENKSRLQKIQEEITSLEEMIYKLESEK